MLPVTIIKNIYNPCGHSGCNIGINRQQTLNIFPEIFKSACFQRHAYEKDKTK